MSRARTVFVVARTGTGRPSLQHCVAVVGDMQTDCGYIMSGWSRFYTETRLGPLLCLKCKRIRGLK